jgi:hypothetical protein
MRTKFQELIHSETGKYIFSIILGIGLASIFRKACNSRNCLVFKSPEIKSLKDNVYKYDNKCYKFHEEAIKCSKNKKTVEIA